MLQISKEQRDAIVQHLIKFPMGQVEPVVTLLRKLEPAKEEKPKSNK